jgi:SWI/SNF-related matrix-associated actin-dependent regulator of chromatin subfamily A3
MSQKRKRVEVDLTGDSDQEEAASAQKAQRGASSNNIHAGGYRSVYGGSTHPAAERSDWLADDADDVNEIVGSSQDGAEGSEELTLYGELAGKIVGVQYYRGVANAGEHILIRREPGNPYDSNAIRVDNVAGHQIGHIPRRVAEKLSKYIDNRWLRVECQLAG